jgi:hypothetical protein
MKVAIASTALLAALATLVAAGDTAKFEIVPGPRSMSDAEKAIAPDPAKGAEHGVVLLEETDRNDNLGSFHRLSYHLRAKILSPEGRALADVEIPMEKGGSDLKTWWGRTILPDGSVVELARSDLKTQSVVKSAWGERQMLKAALPGVVPGCVIDYGYVVQSEGIYSMIRFFLQRNWPVKDLRYRWSPSRSNSAACVTTRVEGKSVNLVRDHGSLLLTAHDLLPVLDEPHMPPKDEVQASATFYYTTSENPEEYWDLRAKRVESELKAFVGNGAAIKEALASMDLKPEAALPEKLQAVYAWIAQNVKNTYLRTAEEEEVDDPLEDEADNAKTVLKTKQGSGRQIDFLFAAMARALGAEASLIYTVDRTERFWNKRLKSFGQFEYTFVGVRAFGEPDASRVIVDPGSGLPYGQVPWEATGTPGLLCTAKGAGQAMIPPTGAAKNREDTHVTVSFSDDYQLLAKWSRTANGATGMDSRRWLRQLDPAERKKRLEEICRGGGAYDVDASELPGLDDPEAPLQIACDLDMGESSLTEDTGQYRYTVTGPWWPVTPEFPAPRRTHPVVLDFPTVDVLAIDVASPPGFAPKDPPPPVKLDTPFGIYRFVVAKSETGFHVDRAFALTPLLVMVEDYGALRKFLQDVENADQTSLLFERKITP